ncbi:hypothetical protein D3C80_2016430 [compost metagenome]
MFVYGVGKAALAHFAEKLSEVIDDQSVSIGEKFRAHFWDFPTRNVSVKSVEKSCVDHLLREGGQ